MSAEHKLPSLSENPFVDLANKQERYIVNSYQTTHPEQKAQADAIAYATAYLACAVYKDVMFFSRRVGSEEEDLATFEERMKWQRSLDSASDGNWSVMHEIFLGFAQRDFELATPDQLDRLMGWSVRVDEESIKSARAFTNLANSLGVTSPEASQ